MQTKKVKPYGMLYSNGREYFVLDPIPVVSKLRQWDDGHGNVFRFVVVPRKKIDQIKDLREEWENIYPIARDIVTNNFTIEYADMPEINIKVLDIGDE